MESRILYGLRHSDPTRRLQAIIEAGRSFDAAYIEPLMQIYEGDSVEALRDMAWKACYELLRADSLGIPMTPAATVQYARVITRAEREIADVVRPPTPKTSPGEKLPHDAVITPAQGIPVANPKKAAKPEPNRTAPRIAIPNRLRVMIAALVLVLAGGLLFWSASGGPADAEREDGVYLQMVQHKAYTAAPLPAETAPDTLSGEIYFSRVSEQSAFYVQEPIGSAPPGGWPLLVTVHGSGGTGLQGFGWAGERALTGGVLLVSPSFANPDGVIAFDASQRDLRAILARVNERYPVNSGATVLFGFSSGGMFASLYAARHPADFAGVHVAAAPYLQTPPRDSSTRYLVTSGDRDLRADGTGSAPASREFVAAMAARGTPVWYAESLPNTGHRLTQRQVDLTFELLKSLQR